jgi:isopenicillin N synthase-like dioxygenase
MVDTIRDGDVAQFADFDNRYVRSDVERRALTEVPVIDFAPFLSGDLAARKRVAQEIRRACIDIGFFYLAGHGIPAAELDELVDWGHRFFALPLDEKMKLHVTRNPAHQGYMQEGGMNPDANPDKAADRKERFSMARELLPGEADGGMDNAGAAQWPEPGVIPGFADFMKAHCAKRLALTQKLVRGFALSLDLPEDHFDAVHRYPGIITIINYYPPLDRATLKKTQWSFSPHTDYGSFTLLSQDALGGLQVRNSAGQWIDVPPVAGTFVVNVGDLLATWTNDLYTSNLHRAVNFAGGARISVPYFVSPRGDALIQCLDTCHSADNPARYAPVTAADYVQTLIRQSNRSGRPGVSARTAERMKG